jgi:hypothetical protein
MTKKDFYAQHDWAAGHNFWVYQFFAGGLLFGIAMPVAILYSIYRCLGTYRRWRAAMPDAPYLPVLGRAILLTAALPATSIGGNPLGPRFSGLIFGLSMGMMIAMHIQLRRLGTRVRPAPARAYPTYPADPAGGAPGPHGGDESPAPLPGEYAPPVSPRLGGPRPIARGDERIEPS